MFLTSYLILAHFLADYPFQPNWLVKYKQKHITGLVLHSMVHFAISALLVFPFLGSVKIWWAILMIFISHNLIDRFKIFFGKRSPKCNGFYLYMLDQGMHIFVIWVVSLYFLGRMEPSISGKLLKYYSDQSVIGFMFALVLATYVWDITRWTYLGSKKNIPYKRDYRMMGGNALIVVIVFGFYWFLK